MVSRNAGPLSSCSRATPDLHRCNLEVAPEQETFSRLQGLHPKRPLAPSPINLGAIQEFRHYTKVSGSQSYPWFLGNLRFGVVCCAHKLPESRGEGILFHGSWNLPRIFREISCGQSSWNRRTKISVLFLVTLLTS